MLERKFHPVCQKCHDFYFARKMFDQDKNWAAHICCVICVRFLMGWLKNSHHMSFDVPIVWRESKDDSSDCF